MGARDAAQELVLSLRCGGANRARVLTSGCYWHELPNE